jgi:glycosyltransferase involved in cell wall biosynthesis
MRVGFDTTPLAVPHPPGVVRVVHGTLEALEAAGRLEVVRLSPTPGQGPRAFRASLPRVAREQGLAGVHSFTSAFQPRGPGRRVQTIHECPWRHGVRENAGWRHRAWARLGPLLADAVVTPSEHTARDLGLRPQSSGGKGRVIPWGVEPRFAPDPPLGEVDEVLLGRYRLPERALVLCLGATRAKKNLAAVLHGVAALHARAGARVHLVVTGPDTPDLRRDLGLAQRLGLARFLSTPGTVEEEHLPGLLRLATAVPVLSHSEGFGLPALEAHACGTPAIVPAGSAAAEAAGPLALTCDPADPESVADALALAVERREDLRFEVPESVADRTWSRTAERVADLWEELA